MSELVAVYIKQSVVSSARIACGGG